MEMSVGTIVTIVLLVTVLILGLVLIRTIFKSSVENINGIDQAIKDQVNKLFTEDSNVKIVIYPQSRLITIKKGNDQDLGFAFSIKNVETTAGTFRYTVTVDDPSLRQKCGINEQQAESWLTQGVGGEGSINIGPSTTMDQPIFVRFRIPESAPACLVRFALNVKKDGQIYGSTVGVDLQVQAN